MTPLTTTRTLHTMITLCGAPAPARLLARLQPLADDQAAFRAEGLDAVTGLAGG